MKPLDFGNTCLLNRPELVIERRPEENLTAMPMFLRLHLWTVRFGLLLSDIQKLLISLFFSSHLSVFRELLRYRTLQAVVRIVATHTWQVTDWLAKDSNLGIIAGSRYIA